MQAACAVSSGCKRKNNWHAEHWLYLFWEKSEPAPCWESASSTSGMGGSHIWAWFTKVFATMCKNMQTSLMNKRSKMALHDKEPKCSKLQNKSCRVMEGSWCYLWNYWQMKPMNQIALWALFLCVKYNSYKNAMSCFFLWVCLLDCFLLEKYICKSASRMNCFTFGW